MPEKRLPKAVIMFLRPDNKNEDLEELQDWVLPVANEFIADANQHYKRPDSEPKADIEYVADGYDDGNWTSVTVPHDWAITGDFVSPSDVSGAMGRLPVRGVGWYRQKLSFTDDDKDKSIYLDVEGAMAFSMVWLNGHLVGGWPNGYVTFRLDLTPYVKFGQENYLAIRAENPQSSKFSRWYPGAGIYRDVWVIKVPKTHVAQYGTHISTRDVSKKSATIDLSITLENKDIENQQPVKVVTKFTNTKMNPSLWGPPPAQEPNMNIAITEVYDLENRLLDEYETPFGIRSLTFDANKGLFVNDEHVYIQGVNQHHDLGALGAAWNLRAGTRQLEMLKELGVNAIRMSHNPPTPDLLRLTDEMGFLVIDEIFDCWATGKSDSDFHLVFEDWHEPDVRSFVRRDRNHPSIITWSVGNEVYEQVQDPLEAGKIFSELRGIVLEEDATRSVTSSLFRAKANDTMTKEMDVVSLNYQGGGMRYGEAYTQLDGTRISPQYDNFHTQNPDSMILGTEVAWSLSSRGSFSFPVSPYISAPVNDTNGGGNSSTYEISAYELYSSESGSTPDRVFYTQDTKPFVAGGFVWVGFDYLGEPYPYDGGDDGPCSSHSGIIDLAGFKKERFYLYQSRWRTDLPAAHIVPHWNWPERVGQVTPVHVFTSGDEAELFVNGKSQGRKKKEPLAYRFRWDDVVYEPGTVNVVVYKDGKRWSTDTVVTTGEATALRLTADRTTITADGEDLTFITAEIIDSKGNVVPTAKNAIHFDVSGPGVIVATDNGYPADLTKFPSTKRNAFNGLALAIVRSEPGKSGHIKVSATGDLKGAEVAVAAKSGKGN
ncbi:hypothetical protein V494_08594 [Pseudogymnoascus sp. VKM F-4513 (FW-928)]|nr:hypothetical protein V494_08594 [Pseudogymnoascus sp. VKM F-4513 (FW-928)]